ncbi:MAG: HEPN domain-containing protein [Patescibacteria group bacterium]|nr:HEPN domain-containing protein [Patescibacteria group bacterium]
MKKNNYEKLAKEWFIKAEEDWGVAHLLYNERSYPAASCFHSHQAAEKFLKGFLVFYGKDIEEEFKIHNLIKLFSYCKKVDKKLPQEMEKSCYFLNKYYIETRYPGDVEQYPWEEVKESLEVVDYLREKILKTCKIF